MGLPLGSTPFSVVDVETTGFSPRLHDRVIEVAVRRLGPDGELEDEYTTLINPGRDVGPTHVHGISATDLVEAPTFEDIVGDVLDRMRGTVLVAHNARFDREFLASEITRCGIWLPDIPTICTLRLAHLMQPNLRSFRLGDCCNGAGVSLSEAHSAAVDAKATSDLLVIYLAWARDKGLNDLAELGCAPIAMPPGPWPNIRPTGRSLTRGEAAAERQSKVPYLAGLVNRLVSHGAEDPDVASYMVVLDRALEDRRVTEKEATELIRTAEDLDLSREQALGAHVRYLEGLVGVALTDGVVTELERGDLDEVCRLLALAPSVLEEMLVHPPVASVAEYSSLAGSSVCFTGTLRGKLAAEPITREDAETIASDNGMIVRPGVTKDLDILVAADPDSMSGKAKKARSYGVRILAESALWAELGVSVE